MTQAQLLIFCVMSKFRSLKSYYLREKRKSFMFKSGSGCSGFSSKWVHFHSLNFLDEVMETENSICNLSNHEELSVGVEENINGVSF